MDVQMGATAYRQTRYRYMIQNKKDNIIKKVTQSRKQLKIKGNLQPFTAKTLVGKTQNWLGKLETDENTNNELNSKTPVGKSPTQTQNQLGKLDTDKNTNKELNSKKPCGEKPRTNNQRTN